MLRRLSSLRLHAVGRVPSATVPKSQRLCGRPDRSRLVARSFSSTAGWRAIVPFKLHDIGEGIAEVEMLEWKVEVGQKVDHFDDLCEVQSDKSTAELTSPTPGIVHSIKVKTGEIVKVGEVLCEIRTEEEGGDEPAYEGVPDSSHDNPSQSAPASETSIEDRSDIPHEASSEAAFVEAVTEVLEKSEPAPAAKASDSSRPKSMGNEFRPEKTVNLDTDHSTSTGVQFSGEATVLPSAPAPVYHGSHDPVPERRERTGSGTKKILLTSPATRSLAGRLGIDLAEVPGSGDKGRITREDVQKYADSRPSKSDAVSVQTAAGPGLQPRGDWAEVTKVEFGRTRKVMYRALGAQAEVPHFGYSHTLDLTPLLPYIKALNPPAAGPSRPSYLASDIPASLVGNPLDRAGTKTTLLSFLVKAMLMAMEEHPIMRAKVVGADKERSLEIRKDGVIGVAVSDPKYGLVTPSLPSLPPTSPLSTITSQLSSLRQNPTKMGTSPNLIISSVGGLGESTAAMPVLPPGGALAICAVGRAKWEVEWIAREGGMKMTPDQVEKGGMRAVLRCPVGWSGDHRVLEGAELIAFTESWKKWIEEPWRWIKVDG